MASKPAKRIGFDEKLVPLIISGEKYCTWRLFDDKNLQRGDLLEFVNSQTGKIFGHARIIDVYEKPFFNIGATELEGHERFKDFNEMVTTYKGYYGDRIDSATVVKVIKFKQIKERDESKKQMSSLNS